MSVDRGPKPSSPLPWMGPRLTDEWPPGWVGVYQAEPDGTPVPHAVVCRLDRIDDDTSCQDAAFIVHACNNHHALCDRVEEQDELLDEVMAERDSYHEAADNLSLAIAPTEVIGEHTNLNDPWSNAIDHLEGERQSHERRVEELEAEVERVRLERDLLWYHASDRVDWHDGEQAVSDVACKLPEFPRWPYDRR